MNCGGGDAAAGADSGGRETTRTMRESLREGENEEGSFLGKFSVLVGGGG